MNNFLRENGLEHAIPVFTYHVMKMKYLDRMTEAQIKELLPAIGDRIRFREGIEKLRDLKKTKSCQRCLETETSSVKSNRSTVSENIAKKREIAVQTLKSHKKLTEKLRSLVIEMISDHVSLSFYFKYENVLKGWNVINFENGSLKCPFCTQDITLRYRTHTERFTWNVCSFQRHLNYAHSNLAEIQFRADAHVLGEKKSAAP